MAAPSNVITIDSSPVATQRPPASSHRLPTVSAFEALQGLQRAGPETISTTLDALDRLLAPTNAGTAGGLERGKTSELWGPPGAGKTALLLQIASRELLCGNKVIWLDCKSSLSTSRLDTVLEQQSNTENAATPTSADSSKLKVQFISERVPTLSHLLARILHPRPDFVPSDTTLMIVRDVNTLVDLDYPRVLFSNSVKTQQEKWRAGRRWAVLGTLIAGLNKMAVLNDLTIVVTSGCASRTRMDSGLGSALVPGIGGAEWDGGVWNRMVLFRDFGCRFVGVQKCQGRSLISREEIGEPGKVVGFEVLHDGTVKQQGPAGVVSLEEPRRKASRSPAKSRKRGFDEVADSEGEEADEYGWAETDEDAFTADAAGEEAPEPPATDTAGV